MGRDLIYGDLLMFALVDILIFATLFTECLKPDANLHFSWWIVLVIMEMIQLRL